MSGPPGHEGRPEAISVIVPAHDEARTIGRLLGALVSPAPSVPDLEVLVVCNGCTDGTARVAREQEGLEAVRVLEIPEPSKIAALRIGWTLATHSTRAFVDADVVIDRTGLRALSEGMSRSGALAAGPARVLDMQGVSPIVRWYYDVWERLPAVRAGLFGRGVVMISEAGLSRLDLSTDLLSDDLAMSEAFAPSERLVVPAATVTIHPPKTVGDLLRRRTRVAQGNRQADQLGVRSGQARTRAVDILAPGIRDPRLAAKIPVFLAVTVLARLLAHRQRSRGTPTQWLRDESSRA